MKSYKHQLLATTALASAATIGGGAALAEAMDPSISVGGFFAHDTHFTSQDTVSYTHLTLPTKRIV